MFCFCKDKCLISFVLLTFTIFNLLLQTRFSFDEIFKRGEQNGVESYQHSRQSANSTLDDYQPRLRNKTKQILFWTTRYRKKQNTNRVIKCGQDRSHVCQLVSDHALINSSHAVVFHGWREDLPFTTSLVNGAQVFQPKDLPPVRYPDQYWVLQMMESPFNFRKTMKCYDALFNWTWTYRADSDVYMPYGRFRRRRKPIALNISKDLLATKNSTVAYISSNCFHGHSHRLDLVRKLQEHIQVDMYGSCGTMACASTDRKGCKIEIGRYYKFFLSLENSLCQDYITEKVFDVYSAGMVPVVYGGANYNLVLPKGSYINVNSFPSAKTLADYLVYLDKNPDEYMKYFQWKSFSELVSDKADFRAGYCQLCEKLHRDYPLGIRNIIPSMTDWLFTNEKNNYHVCEGPTDW